MNLQESIRRILKEERKNILKSKLLSIIKNEGTELAATLSGGMDNLFKILDINNPNEFLDLYSGLDVDGNKEYGQDNELVYTSEDGNTQFVTKLENDYIKLYVRSGVLEGLKYFYDDVFDIERTIKRWFKHEYNLNKDIRSVRYFLPTGDLFG